MWGVPHLLGVIWQVHLGSESWTTPTVKQKSLPASSARFHVCLPSSLLPGVHTHLFSNVPSLPPRKSHWFAFAVNTAWDTRPSPTPQTVQKDFHTQAYFRPGFPSLSQRLTMGFLHREIGQQEGSSPLEASVSLLK